MSHFYPKRLPEVGELVYVSYKSKEDHGFICTLLEYGDIEGYLPMTELSRKRVRSVHSHARINQMAILQVLRVDKERNYIDLSKKNVGLSEKAAGSDKYQKSKNVHSVFNHLAEISKCDSNELCERLLWPLYEQYDYAIIENGEEQEAELDAMEGEEIVVANYTHPHYALRRFALQDEEIFPVIGDQEKAELKRILLHRINTQKVNCQAIIELTCFTEAGIDGIKKAASVLKTACPKVQLKYNAAPSYYLQTIILDQEEGFSLIRETVKILTEAIEKEGGSCEMQGNIRTFDE